MTGFGASFSLPHLPAKVSSLNAERPLSLGGGNGPSCPHHRPLAILGGTGSGGWLAAIGIEPRTPRIAPSAVVIIVNVAWPRAPILSASIPGTLKFACGRILPASRPCASRRNRWLQTRRGSPAPKTAIGGPSGWRYLKNRRPVSWLRRVRQQPVRFRHSERKPR